MKKSVFSHVKHTLVGFVSANPTAEAANMSREQWKQAAGVELKSRSIGILNAETRMSENTGERLEQYGIRNLREHEAPRVGVPEGLRSAICKVFFDCAGAS